MGFGTRVISTLICVIALIGQMVLPTVHAASMARNSGDPLAFAFCGEVSPHSLAQLRAEAPPELLAWLRKAEKAKTPKVQCDLCVSAHGHHLAAAPSISLALLPTTHSLISAAPAPLDERIRLVVLPPLRAPPASI